MKSFVRTYLMLIIWDWSTLYDQRMKKKIEKTAPDRQKQHSSIVITKISYFTLKLKSI